MLLKSKLSGQTQSLLSLINSVLTNYTLFNYNLIIDYIRVETVKIPWYRI